MSDIGQALIQATREVAAENPDFVYADRSEIGGPGCVYVRGGKPSCIVGHAAWNLGLIDGEFEGKDANYGGVEDLLSALRLHDVEPREEAWLETAQDEQDGGMEWGKAVAEADDAWPFES